MENFLVRSEESFFLSTPHSPLLTYEAYVKTTDFIIELYHI
jgi:hypothetical protein